MRYPTDLTDKNLPALELEKMNYWQEKKVFERSVKERPNNKQFVMYDGPPFATGLPHYGHILAGTLKDVMPRYFTMRGYRVERRLGWDCHGVPVEYEVEKREQLQGNKDIHRLGIAEFNEKCRSIVLTYTEEWKKTNNRLARFIDMENDYKTMDSGYMDSVWGVFNQLHKKNFVYEGKKIVAFSPALGTALSDFEAKQNYQKVSDPSITLEFPLAHDKNTVLLVWTTTPWSIPTNIAIAVNLSLQYVQVKLQDSNKTYIVEKNLVSKNFDADKIVSQQDYDVNQLVGKNYLPMFDLQKNNANNQNTNHYYSIIVSDHVTNTDGTGLVHISPAHGEDDFKLGVKYKFPVSDFANENGIFNDGLSEVQGKHFKEADKDIIRLIKGQQRLFKQATIHHDYPFCWRTDKPLMYRAVPAWYVQVTAVKDKIINNNKKINWYPDFVGSKRFHNWLENSKDWAVSRSRYWGCPIPIWRNMNDPSDYIVIESRQQLEELSGKKITDMHRHFIDDIVLEIKGNKYKRIPEVFDCWFESGSMPYAHHYYKFDNDTEFLANKFPADYIAEGIDQTRGWFYTLNVLSTMLYDKPAFKNCIVNGILLGDDNKKMSKSKKNYPNVDEVFTKHGADALRILLLGSPATNAQNLAVTEREIKNQVQNVLLPILNVYKFFAVNANDANFVPKPDFNYASITGYFEQWLVYRTELFKEKITKNYEGYNLIAVCQEIKTFINDLSNWYLHHNRSVFTVVGQEHAEKKSQAFYALYHALNTWSLFAAPVLPYMSEIIFQALHTQAESIHLQILPPALNVNQMQASYDDMELIKQVVQLGQRIREEKNLRLRQPLAKIMIDKKLYNSLSQYQGIIKSMLNIKEIDWIADSSNMLEEKVKLNWNHLREDFSTDMPAIRSAFEKKEFKLASVNSKYTLKVAGLDLTDNYFEVYHSAVKSLQKGIEGRQKDGICVLMDTNLTSDLIKEGECRDLMRLLQNARKDLGFELNQVVDVYLGPKAREVVRGSEELILQTTRSRILDAQVPADAKIGKLLLGKQSEQMSMCLSPKQEVSLAQSTQGLFGGNASDNNNNNNVTIPSEPSVINSFN